MHRFYLCLSISVFVWSGCTSCDSTESAEDGTTSETAPNATPVEQPQAKFNSDEYCKKWLNFHPMKPGWNQKKKAAAEADCLDKMKKLKVNAPKIHASQLDCFRTVSDSEGAKACLKARETAAKKVVEVKLDKRMAEERLTLHTIPALGISVKAPEEWLLTKPLQAWVLKGKTGKALFTEIPCPKQTSKEASACLASLSEAESQVTKTARGWYVAEAKTLASGHHDIRLVNEQRSQFQEFIRIIPGAGKAIACRVNRGGFEAETRFKRREDVCASMARLTSDKAGLTP